jgi:hypothetical protein
VNYISEIREFYDLVEQFELSSSCICLWHALMHQANKARWKDEFSVAISTLELRTGLKRGAIYTARNTLIQRGFIRVKQRDGQQSALYKIISLCPLNEHKPEHNADTNPNTTQTQSEAEPELLDNTTYYPDVDVNKTKEEEELPHTVSDKTPYQKIADEYRRICKSFPKLTILSEARKKSIHARIANGYTSEDFTRLFELAESSDFLKGKNNRDWSATFDWLISDKNMAKVLDGNYNNRVGGGDHNGLGNNWGNQTSSFPAGNTSGAKPTLGTIIE